MLAYAIVFSEAQIRHLLKDKQQEGVCSTTYVIHTVRIYSLLLTLYILNTFYFLVMISRPYT